MAFVFLITIVEIFFYIINLVKLNVNAFILFFKIVIFFVSWTPISAYTLFIDYFDKILSTELSIVPIIISAIRYLLIPIVVLIFDKRFRFRVDITNNSNQNNTTKRTTQRISMVLHNETSF